MNRPPAFVRPPNTASGIQSPYVPQTVPSPILINQNAIPKGPPPLQYNEPSNKIIQSPNLINGRNPAVISSMFNGHLPLPTDNSNLGALSTGKYNSLNNVGYTSLNPNYSSISQESSVDVIKPKNSEDLKPNSMEQPVPFSSTLPGSNNSLVSKIPNDRAKDIAHSQSMSANSQNQIRQEYDLKSQNISNMNPISSFNSVTPSTPSYNLSGANSYVQSGSKSSATNTMVSGSNLRPTIPNFPSPSNMISQHNSQFPYNTSVNQVRSPYYTPMDSISKSHLCTSSQQTASPNFELASRNNVNTSLPSNNLDLQTKAYHSVPTTYMPSNVETSSSLAPLKPLISPTANISAVRSPLMQSTSASYGVLNPAIPSMQPLSPSPGLSKFSIPSMQPTTSSSGSSNYPNIMQPFPGTPCSSTTNSSFMGMPPPKANVSVQHSMKPSIPPMPMNSSQHIRPPQVSPIPSFNPMQRPVQPNFSSSNRGMPPTSFPIHTDSSRGQNTQPSYSQTSVYSNPMAPYPAQFGSSQNATTNVGSNKYPIQQQPSNVNQISRQLGGLSVTQQGWNKNWGSSSIDLMLQRCLIPPEGILPPKPFIAQENTVACSTDIFRCTFTKVPESNSVLQKARLPFGILIHPFMDIEQLTVVNGSTIVRCRSCRTYINPYITFKSERKWECNLCFRINDLPEEFQYDPVTRTYGDPSRRPECREATIEYIAPQEYLLRPPQPACYLYVLDTSRQAIETGYLQVACEVLLSRLSDIPGDKRTLIGFITFSKSVQFYMMAEDQKMVNVLDVGSIDDVFIPNPQDLLVNLHENRELVEELLMTLPEDVANTYSTQTCLGAALTAAHKLLAPIGGRITVMAATLPTLGPGDLKPREDPNQRAAKDITNLGPATDFYKKYALDCSARQIAVDLFTFNSQYIDLATITGISKFSGGCIYHYPGMNLNKNTPNVAQFRNCFDRYLTRKIGFEAVMRIRATRGLAITNFHGNFFVRSTDLLSLPNINPDAGFGMQVIVEEPLNNIRQACFQAALLYTSSHGERRIRVHTMCLPVSGNILDIMVSADQQAVIGFLSKLAVDRCLTSQMSDAREAILNACSDALGAYKNAMSLPQNLVAPTGLQLLPMYCLSILKSISLRYGISTKLDDRVFAMCEVKTLPLKNLIKSLYPDLFAIHDLTERGAINDGEMIIPQPPRLHLSAEFLDRAGVYILDAGDSLIMYIRSYISPNWLNDVLGISNFAAIPQPMHDDPLPQLDNSASELVRNFVAHLQHDKAYAAPLSIIKEDTPERFRFMMMLIEDRSEASHSYMEFLQYVKSQMK